MKVWRILLIFLAPLLLTGASVVFPPLLSSESLRWMSGIVSVLWALEMYFLRHLESVSGVDGLTAKERERLTLRLESVRRRIWSVGIMCLFCSVVLLVISSSGWSPQPMWAVLCVGCLVGVCVYYLSVIPVWYAEAQSFIDKARARVSQNKERERLIGLMKR